MFKITLFLIFTANAADLLVSTGLYKTCLEFIQLDQLVSPVANWATNLATHYHRQLELFITITTNLQ